MIDSADPSGPLDDAPLAPEVQLPDDATAPVEPPPALAADGPASEQPRPAPAQPAAPPEEAPKIEPSAVVRYGHLRHIGQFRHNLETQPPSDTMVVVRTERGVELAQVVVPVCDDQAATCAKRCLADDMLKQFVKANGSEYPFSRDGRILRLATAQDISDQEHLNRSIREQIEYCRDQATQFKLPMRLVTVENLLGGERIIFYFTSEGRVDFRELVRGLASQYRTRIEMRQVGARDEARLVADYERCGQRCCCQQFLKNLLPVSIRMAKTQKATLDPAKISGRCGRLMCCLRYEDAGYEDLRGALPKRNVWVRTEEVVGKVLNTQILTQLIKLITIDGSIIVVPNDTIIERNVTPPDPPQAPRPRPVRQSPPPRSRPRPVEREASESSSESSDQPQIHAEEPTAAAGEGNGGLAERPSESTPTSKRRRRRRKPRSQRGGQGASAPASRGEGSASQRPAGGSAPPVAKKRRRRGRRGRNKPPGGGSAPPAS